MKKNWYEKENPLFGIGKNILGTIIFGIIWWICKLLFKDIISLDWLYITVLILILIIAGSLLFSKSLNKSIKKGKEYEALGINIYNSMKRSLPDISLEKAKSIINGTIDEKWFISLEMNQIHEVKKCINDYLEVNDVFNEVELRKLVLDKKKNLD